MVTWTSRRFFSCLLGVAALVSPGVASSESTTPLPFVGFGEMVVDPGTARVFVSSGPAGSAVAVFDLAGNLQETITGQQGATGMALDQASGTLYVALQNASAISVIDTATLVETGRLPTTGLSAPRWLALAGGRLWFSYGCPSSGWASMELDGSDIKTVAGGPSYCATFAPSPTESDVLAAVNIGVTPRFYVYDVSSSTPDELRNSFRAGNSDNVRQIAFAPEGTQLFVASGAPYQVQALHLSDLTLANAYLTGPYPLAVAVTGDGAYVAGGADAAYAPDIFVFSRSGGEVRRWELGTNALVARGLAFGPTASQLFAVTKNSSSTAYGLKVYGSPTIAPAATSTTLGLSASTVAFNKQVTLTARVVGGGGGIVSFYATPYGGTKKLVKTVALASGRASLTYTMKKKTTFTATYAGTDLHAPSTSLAKVVRVRARATVKLGGFYGRSGKYKLYRATSRPRVTGTVAPNHAGHRLRFVLQRYSSRRWRTIDTAALPIQSTGSAYAVLRGNATGPYRVRTKFSGDSDHLAHASAWAYLRVTR